NVDYLKKNQQLGNETRKLEFKRGGGSYLKNILKTDVGTYMSAFLNSSGGTLLIGVDDEGFVQGISLDHKAEDKVRRDIDGVMRRIEPAVLPNIYSVSFIPVQDKIQCNLKVIKITVGAVKTKMLYESPGGGVFIRRDGSIQGPLKTKDLQELCHM
ncbi:schlafen-like protein 1, partial [Anneissia japonica]